MSVSLAKATEFASGTVVSMRPAARLPRGRHTGIRGRGAGGLVLTTPDHVTARSVAPEQQRRSHV